MKQLFSKARRLAYVSVAAAIAGVALVPALAGEAFAYTELTTRSIEMSTAAPSATASYKVSFTATTAVKNIRVDFCSDSPIYEYHESDKTCVASGGLTGLSLSSATLDSSTGLGSTGWTKASSTATSFTLSSSSTASGSVTFTINSVTNPDTAGTFYARIYTYVAQTNDYTDASAPGTVADFGGIALSISTAVSVTALVQEQLTFCVSATTMSTNCSGQSTPALTLGNGTPVVLSSNEVDAKDAYTQVITNATGGVIVRMHTSNSCAGLSTNGGTDSCPIAAVGGSEVKIVKGATTGNAVFGLCVTGGGNTTVSVPYDNSGTSPDACEPSAAPAANANTYFGMDDSGTTGVTSTYGSQLFKVNGPTTGENNTCTFAATSAPTTPAGAYTADESLIATGTF